MIHEGGHSMHSYYSKRNNPFFCYDYTIFEAEVAPIQRTAVVPLPVRSRGIQGTESVLLGKQLDDIVAHAVPAGDVR
jgi:oligoendopeptidase F